MGGDLIREARKRAGLTQAELAKRAGTTQSAIARWETGRSAPSFDNVDRLVRLCGFYLDIAMHDWVESGMADDMRHAQRRLGLTVDERVAELIRLVRLYRAVQASARESMRDAS